MMIVNHFLDLNIFGILIPDDFALETTNAATGTGSIGAQADLCYTTWGRMPNVVLVDFFNVGKLSWTLEFNRVANSVIGNVFAAQNTLNGL